MKIFEYLQDLVKQTVGLSLGYGIGTKSVTNAAVNVIPEPPHCGAALELPRGLPGGLLFVQAPGVWESFQVLTPGWNHGIC